MKYPIKFYLFYYFRKAKANLLYFLMKLIYFRKTKIEKGDLIKCFGIGYPHWKGEIFECTMIFKDKTIGIKNCIRVAQKDFRKC
jgi:hypothetical protein